MLIKRFVHRGYLKIIPALPMKYFSSPMKEKNKNNQETHAMSPAVEGAPYSSNRRMRSPNCPCKSPNILIGALSCNTLGSLENILSALSQRSAISLQSKKNCRRTGGFQPRGFRRCAITWSKKRIN